MSSLGSTANPGPPPIDEHIVVSESGYELDDGELVLVPPAHEPHAVRHSKITALLEAHVAEDFNVAVDMLTRMSKTSVFAPLCVTSRILPQCLQVRLSFVGSPGLPGSIGDQLLGDLQAQPAQPAGDQIGSIGLQVHWLSGKVDDQFARMFCALHGAKGCNRVLGLETHIGQGP